jgi:hypothetical protein
VTRYVRDSPPARLEDPAEENIHGAYSPLAGSNALTYSVYKVLAVLVICQLCFLIARPLPLNVVVFDIVSHPVLIASHPVTHRFGGRHAW